LAKIYVERIEDTRITKRKYVIDRAKDLLGRMFQEEVIDPQQITEQIKDAVRSEEISDYKGLPAGPGIEKYDEIIIVEGRADVINLLKNGIKNVVAIEGTSVPKAIVDITKEKITTVFLDGDRGGDLILKELMAVCEIDFVLRAPRGKEVEELQKKEIFKILRTRIPAAEAKQEINNGEVKEITVSQEKPTYTNVRVDNDKIDTFKSVLEDLIGTRAACFLDGNLEILGRVPVKEMFSAMRELKADTLIFDGDIDQKLVNQCLHNGIKYIVGMKVERIRTPEGISILTIHDLKG
jgi:DNA primase